MEQRPLNTAAGGEVQCVEGLWVSGDKFGVLGAEPVIGRVFTADDDRPRLRLAGRGDQLRLLAARVRRRAVVLQQTIRLDGVQFEIIGVTPPYFFGLDVGRRFDVAIPLCGDALTATAAGRDS